MGVEQTVSTRNQSTVNFTRKNLFILDNRFTEGVFKNTTGANFTLQAGQLVARDTSVPGGFKPVTSGNLADTIGISAYEGETVLAANQTANMNIGTKGTIETTALVLPATVTLDTAVGNKSLRDVLEALGFHLNEGAVEMTEIDN